MTDDLFGFERPVFDEKEARQTWQTPRRLAAELVREFDLDLDVAAEWDNAVCREFWTKKHDALAKRWDPSRRKWCNPPFSNGKAFAKRAAADADAGGTTVFLCLDRGAQWLEAMLRANRWWQFFGRVDYDAADGIKGSSVTFGSVLILFDRSVAPGFAGWRDVSTGVEVWPERTAQAGEILSRVEAELAPGVRERLADPTILDDDLAPFERGAVEAVSRIAELLGLGWD